MPMCPTWMRFFFPNSTTSGTPSSPRAWASSASVEQERRLPMRSTTPAVSASGTIRLPSTSCSLHCRRKHDADGILKCNATGEDLDVHSLELARHHLIGSHDLSCLCQSSRRSRFGLRQSVRDV